MCITLKNRGVTLYTTVGFPEKCVKMMTISAATAQRSSFTLKYRFRHIAFY